MVWKDCGSYWLHTSKQRTPAWFSARENRLTASRFGAAIGHCLQYTTPEEVRRELADPEYRKEKFRNKPQWQKDAIQHGVEMEPVAISWYEKKFRQFVDEVGFAVPKFDERIGGSPDGLVGKDGMVEIKCPRSMYNKIKDEHYDQIQGCLQIFDRQWCDYVVYSTSDKKIFVQRIRRDDKYWQEVLYPQIQDFLVQ